MDELYDSLETEANTMDELYDYLAETPWITVANNVIYIRVAGEEGEKPKKKKVLMQNVVDYFVRYSGSRGFMSSYRFLGGIGGDWRPINNLAEECLEIYKVLNVEKLRRLARKAGLEPKF